MPTPTPNSSKPAPDLAELADLIDQLLPPPPDRLANAPHQTRPVPDATAAAPKDAQPADEPLVVEEAAGPAPTPGPAGPAGPPAPAPVGRPAPSRFVLTTLDGITIGGLTVREYLRVRRLTGDRADGSGPEPEEPAPPDSDQQH